MRAYESVMPKADVLTLSHTHRWSDGSSLKTAARDGYYSRAMWATQHKSSAAVRCGRCRAATVSSVTTATRLRRSSGDISAPARARRPGPIRTS